MCSILQNMYYRYSIRLTKQNVEIRFHLTNEVVSIVNNY